MIIIIVLLPQPSTSSSFNVEEWSEEFQITYEQDANYKNLAMPTVQENTDGSLQMMYVKQPEGSTFQLANIYTDKLGRSITYVSNSTDFIDWRYRTHIHISDKGIYYDEVNDRIRFITLKAVSNKYLWFIVFDNQFNIISERRIHVEDVFENAADFGFPDDFVVYWDSQGTAHIAGALIKNHDENDQRMFMIYYMKVGWDPFSISVEILERLPYLEIPIIIPQIHMSESGKVGIVHPDHFGGAFHRVINWRNVTGDWETRILDDMDNPAYLVYMAANGIYIDEEDTIHLVWVNPSFYLEYLRIDDKGNVEGPSFLTHIPVSRVGALDVHFQVNSTGSLFIAYNVMVYNAKSLWIIGLLRPPTIRPAPA